ncbi:sulfatase-like hydrolase/transferase [Bremerella sp. JC770]|uniref:sulfatase-like hydrolase/transferase n=1 Tax=Bremerella sp. JC770 TaxID=3232137 RepID=UPI0034599310
MWASALARKPNVVIFLTDDQGTLDAGCYGAKDLQTPNMDRLAQEGVRFTQAYAHMVCCPARAALLTGRHPQRGGINDWAQGNVNAKHGRGLALSEITLAETLRAAGYRTALFGKWHLGAALDQGPNRQGFDEFFGIRGGFIDNYNHFYLHQQGYHDLFEGDTEVHHPGEFFPDLIVEQALEFIERNKNEPFFLYVPFNTPHYPEQPPAKYLAMYAELPEPRKTYAAFLTMTDFYMGQILDQLERFDLEKETIVIFQSDNGHSVEDKAIASADHGSGLPLGHNYGANCGGGYTGKWIGHKATFLEGGVRVPAIIRAPSQIPSGVQCDEVITAMDWYPTVLELCDVAPSDNPLDGKSLVSLLNGKTSAPLHPVIYFQWVNSWAVHQGDWKLICRRGRSPKSQPAFDLYRLDSPAPETHDFSKEHPDKVAELQALYDTWHKSVFPATDL